MSEVYASIISKEYKRNLQDKIKPLIEQSLRDMYEFSRTEAERHANQKLDVLKANADNDCLTDAEFRDLVRSV